MMYAIICGHEANCINSYNIPLYQGSKPLLLTSDWGKQKKERKAGHVLSSRLGRMIALWVTTFLSSEAWSTHGPFGHSSHRPSGYT